MNLVSGQFSIYFLLPEWPGKNCVLLPSLLSPSHCPLLRSYSKASGRKSHLASRDGVGLEEILPEPEPMRQDSDTDTLWRLEPDISRTNPGAACVPPATMLVQCVLRVIQSTSHSVRVFLSNVKSYFGTHCKPFLKTLNVMEGGLLAFNLHFFAQRSFLDWMNVEHVAQEHWIEKLNSRVALKHYSRQRVLI